MLVAILGCGWSGLLASIRIKTLYPTADVVCIDKDFRGGLLGSEVVNGYLFDIGGSHVVFSRKREIIEGITMGGDWVARERKAYVLFNNTFIPYPFENGIYVLPPEDRVRYGLSLIKALMNYQDEKPANLKEWIIKTFGEEVARDYLIPYNEKIWKRPLNEMSADWVYVPGRLPLPSIEDIVKSIAGILTIGYKEQAIFYYPRRGGIIKQWEYMRSYAESLGVRFLEGEVREVKSSSNGYVINGILKS